jgi:hypothetical protein
MSWKRDHYDKEMRGRQHMSRRRRKRINKQRKLDAENQVRSARSSTQEN